VREVEGGAVSGWLVHDVRPGQLVEVQPPSGSFTPDLTTPGHHVLIAAGSGITPVLSIAGSVLAASERSTVTLLYGNRRSDTVMFADEVADLKDAHPSAVQLVHVLSREPQEVELFSGRLDVARMGRILEGVVPPDTVDEWFLCGPHVLVSDLRKLLVSEGVPKKAIHAEIFHVEPSGRSPRVRQTSSSPDGVAGSAEAPGARVTLTLDGRTSWFRLAPDGPAVLDAALTVRADAPFACKGGVCGTCRAKVLEGSVEMDTNWALEPDEVEKGYVLTCQSHPTSETLVLDYDA
jgi:ring-1,2-phenylacetyl-CoA epoxidase subunit PaaE